MQLAAGPSVRGFIDAVFMEPTKIMIVGADSSVSTEPVAELAPFWNLVQVCEYWTRFCYCVIWIDSDFVTQGGISEYVSLVWESALCFTMGSEQ